MLQILNLGKKPRLILRSKHLQNFSNAKKTWNGYKSGKVGQMCCFWSCRGRARWSKICFLSLDLHFRRWTIAMVRFRLANMFPNPKEKQKDHILTYIGLIAIATAQLAESTRPSSSGSNQIAYFFWKRLVLVCFSSTNHIVQKFHEIFW